MKNLVLAIVLSALTLTLSAAEPYRGTVQDFVGINSNVGAYDDDIVARLGEVAKWVREYHNWDHFEKNENVYAWDDTTPSGYGTWPFHTKYVEACIDNDINLLICTQGSAKWIAAAGKTEDPPFGKNDGTQEAHYIDKSEFMAQLVARYGSTEVDADLLETADKKTGLGFVTYYEDANEPDFTWHEPRWPGDLYGVHLNAVHDARNLESDDDYPILGIKTTDPNAVHVMGGLASFDEDYLAGILDAAGGDLPFEVINFHHYCTPGWGATEGACPEHKSYGLKPAVDDWQGWRDAHAPGMPIWCTEFGWDTYKSPSGGSSYVYAGEQSQANYLIRALFLMMGYGIEKGFVFFDKDPDSEGIVQYSSSGILTDKAHGLEEKTAFYYLATLQNLLGDYSFVRVDQYAEGDPEVYSYLLQSPDNDKKFCFVMWCREWRARNDDGTTIANYRTILPGLTNASIIRLKDKSTQGEAVAVSVENAGSENAAVTLPELSETPIFLFAEGDLSTTVKQTSNRVETFDLGAYPNPFNPAVQISYSLDRQTEVRLDVVDLKGRLVKELVRDDRSAGRHVICADFSGDNLSSGTYIVRLFAGEVMMQRKVCFLK